MSFSTSSDPNCQLAMRAGTQGLSGFTGVTLLGLTGAVVILLSSSKTAIFLWVNDHTSPAWDPLFRWGTFLGDGWVFAGALLPLLLWRRWPYWAGLAAAALLTLFTSASLKTLYQEEKRPVAFFEERGQSLRLVPGVETHSYRSFPSGHTMTAFACLGFLAGAFRYPWLQGILAVLAWQVAYSRMYLAQHFLLDVTVGAALGLIIAGISLQIVPYLARRFSVSPTNAS